MNLLSVSNTCPPAKLLNENKFSRQPGSENLIWSSEQLTKAVPNKNKVD